MIVKDKKFIEYLSEDTIQNRIGELASQINDEYRGRNPIFVAILNGSFMFASDIFKHLDMAAEITFIKVASYEQMASSGDVKNLIGLNEPLYGRDVIVLEDIIDTGKTMEKILEMLDELGPKTIEIVSLLHKPEALKTDIDIKYLGFEIPDKFVVGYGLDYDGLGRNFKAIYQLDNNQNS